MADAVLALNAGSSSLKFGVFETAECRARHLVFKGEVEDADQAPHFTARDIDGRHLADECWSGIDSGREARLHRLLDWIDQHLDGDVLVAVGHRVVHGGPDYRGPVLLTEDVLKALDALTPWAPLHQPQSLAPMRAVLSMRPGLAQVACFDTAFHHTMPAVAARYALPRAYEKEGVRRYGFHGLSYEYISRTLRGTAPDLASGRVIVAHLGNGASLCALRDGRSVDTTMGFSALDGLVMGTRCGALDPGVILYMLQQQKLDAAAVERMLYKESGLLGVSGISGDMRDLTASPDPRAQEAIELFVYRIGREAAALAGSLGGLDGLVFTGGIGEHASDIRAAVCERLRWLGIVLDGGANLRQAARISTPDSKVEVRVMATDEEAMIARHTLEVTRPGHHAPGRCLPEELEQEVE